MGLYNPIYMPLYITNGHFYAVILKKMKLGVILGQKGGFVDPTRVL